jgi:hypothetical protein
MNYDEWQESVIACKECGWCGYGRDAKAGEFFSDGAQHECPQCAHRFGFVVFPTLNEALSDARANSEDRLAAEIVHSRHERFERSKLFSTSQLPDLNQLPHSLTWDVVKDSQGEDFVVIRNGRQEVWRGLSFYENYKRFADIAAILKQKYGNRLCDLIPTAESKLDLYGDKLISLGRVDQARAALASIEDASATADVR